MLVLNLDSCSVSVLLYFLFTLVTLLLRAAYVKMKKRNCRFRPIFQSMHSLSSAVEKLKSTLDYQVIDVVTYQENWDDAYNSLCFQRNILRLGSLQTQNFNGYM